MKHLLYLTLIFTNFACDIDNEMQSAAYPSGNDEVYAVEYPGKAEASDSSKNGSDPGNSKDASSADDTEKQDLNDSKDGSSFPPEKSDTEKDASSSPDSLASDSASDKQDHSQKESSEASGDTSASTGHKSSQKPVSNAKDPLKDWVLVKKGKLKMAFEEDIEFIISKDFYMQKKEVSQKEWKNVFGSGNNPSYNILCGDDCPVENVSWHDALLYANKLSQKDGKEQCYNLSSCSGDAGINYSCSSAITANADFNNDGKINHSDLNFCKGYRLPSNSEWEIAARLDNSSICTSGNYPNKNSYEYDSLLSDYGWNRSNSNYQSQIRGTKKAKSALYDMFGNVAEWTWSNNQEKITRGGHYNSSPHYCSQFSKAKKDASLRSEVIGLRLVIIVN